MTALYSPVNVQASPVILVQGRELVLLAQLLALGPGERRKVTWLSQAAGTLRRWQIVAPSEVHAVSLRIDGHESLTSPVLAWELNTTQFDYPSIRQNSLITIMLERQDQ